MENGNGKLLEKIRALFRLADKTRGASAAEADLAMEKAQMLMTKYGIEQVTVEEIGAEAREARAFNIHQRYVNTGRPRWPEDQYIRRILMAVFNVRVIWSTHYTRTKAGRSKECVSYLLVGEPHDTEIGEMVIHEIYPIMWHLYRNYRKD